MCNSTSVVETGSWNDATNLCVDMVEPLIYIQFQIILISLSVPVVLILNLARSDLSDPLKV